MHIDELKDLKDYFNVWKLIDGYNYIGINLSVCGGEPTIVGTRIQPENIHKYGTFEEIMKDFELSHDEVNEAIRLMKNNEV